MPSPDILTIGHSSLTYDSFLAKLRQADVTAIADVRSIPYSRRNPQFNRETLKDALTSDGIAYVFLGEQLGGRPKGEAFFCDGVADYEAMARTPAFAQGLDRVIAGSSTYRIALMCAEHDPLDCHRCLLVGRALYEKGASVKHVLSDGMIIPHRHIEQRLLDMSDKNDGDLFETNESRLATAYRRRSLAVAYSERKPISAGPRASGRT